MKGFFKSSEVHGKPPPSTVLKCGACGLYKKCDSPKMSYTGTGRKRIYIVGEAPGQQEDERGKQFVGKAGMELERHLRAVGIDMRRDCWLDNSLMCRPPDNRTPTSKEIGYCGPHIDRAIKELEPRVIIPLGLAGVRSVLRSLWKENPGSMTRWAGWRIPSQRLRTWICPTYHPSFVLRSKEKQFNDRTNPVLTKMFRDHLKAAVSIKDDPYPDGVPDYDKEVECVLDTDRAGRILRKMMEKGGEFAFDYETTAIKPETKGGAIVCCSVCWNGRKTIAYPWHGDAVRATGELLRSPHPKIGWNIKFEDRWTRKEFGHPVRNWKWDGMVATHVLDSRPGICSAKFQAFVLLGTDLYNEHIETQLKGKKGKRVNRILEEVNTKDLLHYCGMDSLLEYQIAQKQREQFG